MWLTSFLRTLIDSMKSYLDNMKLGGTDGTAKEDSNSPSEILKLVPEVFLREHLTERWASCGEKWSALMARAGTIEALMSGRRNITEGENEREGSCRTASSRLELRFHVADNPVPYAP